MSSYDVELEMTDEQPKSRYLTKRDAIRIALGLVVLLIILYPAYLLLLQRAQKHMCATNLMQMFTAVGLYAESNDERLPPVYVTAENQTPLIENGAAYSWVNLVDGYIKDRTNFTCPAAEPEEAVKVKASTGPPIDLTYGMYAPLGGEPHNQIDNPDEVVLIAETSNYGVRQTFDPIPFRNLQGSSVPADGFLIGYNDSNMLPTRDSRFVTRLAFYGTQNGVFQKKGRSRHQDGIQMVTVGGQLHTIGPEAATFSDGSGSRWQVPKTRRFR